VGQVRDCWARAGGRLGLWPRLLVLLVVALAGVGGAFGSASASACANEQLRVGDHSTELPDCRSYEMVTPPFKNGDPLTATNEGYAVAVNASGEAEAVGFSDIGGFGGAENDNSVNGSTYVARRGSGGWASAPAGFSGSRFQDGGTPGEFEMLDFSSDLRTGLFFAAPLSAPTPLFLGAYAQPVGGSAVEVGPLIEPAKAATFTAEDETKRPKLNYAGATSDLDHVFFYLFNGANTEERNWLWSADGTVANASLYEYGGHGSGEPELVGVRGGHGSHELISQCGAILGGSSLGVGGSAESQPADGYNAIAAGGARVFFTAVKAHPASHACSENAKHEPVGTGPLVNEVWARVPPPCKLPCEPTGLESVSISEPSEADCAACRTGHSKVTVTEKSALFQAANEAGTKVFFLSEQELLPGAAGDNLYEYDFNAPEGEKVSLVARNMPEAPEGIGGVARVSENGEMVYLVSEAVLASNVDAKGEAAREGTVGEPAYNLYAFNTVSRRFVFVAALSKEDSQDWRQEDGRPVQATAPDGRFLLFSSVGDLTPGAGGSGAQLYRYDARAGEAGDAGALQRVSIGGPGSFFCPATGRVEAGFDCNGNFAMVDNFPASAGFPQVSYVNSVGHPQLTAITGDGSRVFFDSPAGLTAGAQNGACALEVGGACEVFARNVYEWEQAGAGGCAVGEVGGCLYLISDGQGDHAVIAQPLAALLGADPSGANVFFRTTHALVGQDSDTIDDIYDARVGGGFPAPTAPTLCSGVCGGPSGVPPVLGVPGSTVLTGSGNLAAPAPVLPAKPAVKKPAKCKKGFVRRKSKGKSRCVRSKKRPRGKAGNASHRGGGR
jgi:hypothetical protein